MIEIIWNGRGGQGAFTAARLLGTAWSLRNEQSFALAFPSFGPERRGAPIRAFTKLSNAPITNRSEIQKSDFIIYLDDTLFDETVISGLKTGGKIILNTTRQYDDPRIITVAANRISDEILHMPIANTAMLGALAAVCPDVSLRGLEQAIDITMPKRLVNGNKAVVRAAYGEVTA